MLSQVGKNGQTSTLEERFKAWLRRRDDVRDLDEDAALADVKHADFLYRDRVVIEIKGLHEPPDRKINAILEEMARRPEVRALTQPRTILEVARMLPDGVRMERRLDQAISGSVKTAYRKAKHQVSETIAAIEGANIGLIIFFNETISRFRPDDLGVIVARLLNGDERRGCPHFGCIGAVATLSAAHQFASADDIDLRPMHFLVGPRCLHDLEAELELQQLLIDWFSEISSEPPLFTVGSLPPIIPRSG